MFIQQQGKGSKSCPCTHHKGIWRSGIIAPHILTSTVDGGKWSISGRSSGCSSLMKEPTACNKEENWVEGGGQSQGECYREEKEFCSCPELNRDFLVILLIEWNKRVLVLSKAALRDDLWGIWVQFPTFLITCWHYLPGHFTRGQRARKLCEVSFGGAGEGRRRSVGLTVCEMKYCKEWMRRRISRKQ